MRTQIWWLRLTCGEGQAHSRRGPGNVLSTRQTTTVLGQDGTPFPIPSLRCCTPTPSPLLLGAPRSPIPAGSCPCIVRQPHCPADLARQFLPLSPSRAAVNYIWAEAEQLPSFLEPNCLDLNPGSATHQLCRLLPYFSELKSF